MLIIREYKIESTTIRFDNEDLGTEEDNLITYNLIMDIILKKITRDSQIDL